MPVGRGSQGHRLRSLEGWRRVVCTAAIVLFALLPIAAASRAVADGWQPTGDVATIGLRSLDAWTSQAPLVGQPTTGEEYSGIPSNHPGPIANWTIGPVMRVLGPQAGILIGVALINGAAIGAALWLAFRRGGPNLLLIVGTLMALLIWSIGPGCLFDAYNSELPTFPIIAAALAAWAVLLRDLRVLPLFAVAASYGAQPHVAGATLVAPMVVIVIIGLVSQWRRDPERVRAQRTWILLAAGLFLLCWIPPILQELAGPSNLSALVRTRGSGGPAIGLAFVGELVATAVAPIPIFARTSGAYGFLVPRGPLAVVLAALVIGGGGSLTLDQRLRARRRNPSLLFALTATATVVAALAWASSPPVVAYRVDSFRWLWVTSLLLWLTLIWSAWPWVPAECRRKLSSVAPALLAVVAVLLGGWAIATTSTSQLRDDRYIDAVDTLASETLATLPAGSYHLAFDGPQSLVTIGPGLALRLEDAGHPVTVDGGPFGRAYGSRRTDPDRKVEGTLTVVDGEPELQDGDEVLATTTVIGGDKKPVTISVVLER